jgi:predicted permease
MFGVSLGVRNQPVAAQGVLVSGSYFPVLGLNAARGRLLTPDDDRVMGANYVAVISYAFWENKFGRGPDVVGEHVVVNGSAFTIIGVAPQGFDGTTVGSKPVIWVPITMQEQVQVRQGWQDRRSYWIYLFARLKPGVSQESARTVMNSIYQPIITDIEVPLQQEMKNKEMVEFKAKKLLVEPGARGQSQVHREAKTPIVLLFVVTGIVLLIACANIANLLLARGAGRATEMGVRLALGATRRTVVAQLLTESVLLAVVGGAASLFVAKWTISGISALLPPQVGDTLHFSLRMPVILFAAGLSIVTGILFGLFPALHSTRSDLIGVIRAGAGQLTGGRAAARFRAALVTAQIALSTALLIMSALFLRSLVNVSKADLGLKVDRLATFSVDARLAGYDTLRSAVLFNRVEEELATIPGVTAVAAARVPLIANSDWETTLKIQGIDCSAEDTCQISLNRVSAGFFAALDVPVLAGREFTAADRLGAPKVAVVNQAFARKYKMGNDAVGKFISDGNSDSLNVQIVGLARDIKYANVKDEVPPEFYRPWRQDAHAGDMSFYVKTRLSPGQVLGAMRTTMQRLDPNLPVEELKTMPQQIRETNFMDRMISILASSFALLATLLASVGLYGVLSYTVEQRTREIGVRMALGANSASVQGLVMRQVGRMVVIGCGVGIVAALAAGRAARSLLYRLEGHDPVAFTLAVVLLACVALLAGWIPARRAARVHPMQALRYD